MKNILSILCLFLCLLITAQLNGQPNCQAYKYFGDDLKYEACIAAEKRAGHYQFSKEYQIALDQALAIDSSFAFAYKAKSTAYLKSGDFITWIALMDKAVYYNPKENLDYRGWCRFQFFNDYEGAIKDLELLDSLVDYDIGHCQNGFYHLHIARALCYKSMGQKEKAISIILEQFKNPTHYAGLFDYLHLGVLYLETDQYQKAIEAFKKQEQENDLAENRYYIAMTYKKLNNKKEYLGNLTVALKKYSDGVRLQDPYVEQKDKIYLSQIKNELEIANKL